MADLMDHLRKFFDADGETDGDPFALTSGDICGTVTMTAQQGEQHTLHKETVHGGHLPRLGADATPFQRQMNEDMSKMMVDMHAPGYSDDPNVDFLAMMIPHHQGAIDMARLQLVHGDDPLVRRLAEEIIDGQQVEIEAMRARLEILRAGPDASLTRFPALDGTRKTERATEKD